MKLNSDFLMRIGNIDANFGQIFLNDQKGNFMYHSDLGIKGNAKDLQIIGNQVIVGVNDQKIRVFKRH